MYNEEEKWWGVEKMNISVQKLLTKIESELKQAKMSTDRENLREKVYSIKILCELLLDEKETESGKSLLTPAMVQPMIEQKPFPQSISLNQPKKLEMDDGANGDSLFDF